MSEIDDAWLFFSSQGRERAPCLRYYSMAGGEKLVVVVEDSTLKNEEMDFKRLSTIKGPSSQRELA